MSVYKALNTWLLLKLVSRRSYSKMWKDRGESREHEVTEAGRDVCIDDVFRAAAALREERGREKATGRMKERCVRNWTRTRVDHRELIPTSVCVTLLAHGSYLTALCLRPRGHDSCIIYLKARWKIVLTSRARPGKAFVRHALGCCYCRCRLHRKWLPSPRYVRGCAGLVRVAVRLTKAAVRTIPGVNGIARPISRYLPATKTRLIRTCDLQTCDSKSKCFV